MKQIELNTDGLAAREASATNCVIGAAQLLLLTHPPLLEAIEKKVLQPSDSSSFDHDTPVDWLDTVLRYDIEMRYCSGDINDQTFQTLTMHLNKAVEEASGHPLPQIRLSIWQNSKCLRQSGYAVDDYFKTFTCARKTMGAYGMHVCIEHAFVNGIPDGPWFLNASVYFKSANGEAKSEDLLNRFARTPADVKKAVRKAEAIAAEYMNTPR